VDLKVEDAFEEEYNVAEAEATEPEEPVLQLTAKMTEEDLEREAQLLSKLSAQQMRIILEDVCSEMLSGLEVLACLFSLSKKFTW